MREAFRGIASDKVYLLYLVRNPVLTASAALCDRIRPAHCPPSGILCGLLEGSHAKCTERRGRTRIRLRAMAG